MRLASQNNIQRLFYSADKKHSFNDVLKEVQTFISNNYSALVVEGINKHILIKLSSISLNLTK